VSTFRNCSSVRVAVHCDQLTFSRLVVRPEQILYKRMSKVLNLTTDISTYQ